MGKGPLLQLNTFGMCFLGRPWRTQCGRQQLVMDKGSTDPRGSHFISCSLRAQERSICLWPKMLTDRGLRKVLFFAVEVTINICAGFYVHTLLQTFQKRQVEESHCFSQLRNIVAQYFCVCFFFIQLMDLFVVVNFLFCSKEKFFAGHFAQGFSFYLSASRLACARMGQGLEASIHFTFARPLFVLKQSLSLVMRFIGDQPQNYLLTCSMPNPGTGVSIQVIFAPQSIPKRICQFEETEMAWIAAAFLFAFLHFG